LSSAASVVAGRDLLYDKLMTFTTGHFYYAARLIVALLIATLVPLLIDRRSRR